MEKTATNKFARELLAGNEAKLAQWIPHLIVEVARELGMPRISADSRWPVDIFDVVHEFLTSIAMNDLERISEPDSIFEQLGCESARGGLDLDQLSAAIRLSIRRIQTQVHRAGIAAGPTHDSEVVVELLGRVMAAGEAVVGATRRGYEIAAIAGVSTADDDIARRLASALIYGRREVTELAVEAGWDEDTLVCAVLATPDRAADIRSSSSRRLAYFPRERDVVLIHPVEQGRLATTLRPLLEGLTCTVGPAVPLADLHTSLDLAQRARALVGSPSGADFADDVLLELACSADPGVVEALRRKHFAEIDALPDDQRSVLLETLREWLLQWGHRPGIADKLGVHPQTVSGRVNRLKDLLADDLEDPRSRSELLVLLVAERVEQLGAD